MNDIRLVHCTPQRFFFTSALVPDGFTGDDSDDDHDDEEDEEDDSGEEGAEEESEEESEEEEEEEEEHVPIDPAARALETAALTRQVAAPVVPLGPP
jgi:hypothetical protein